MANATATKFKPGDKVHTQAGDGKVLKHAYTVRLDKDGSTYNAWAHETFPAAQTVLGLEREAAIRQQVFKVLADILYTDDDLSERVQVEAVDAIDMPADDDGMSAACEVVSVAIADGIDKALAALGYRSTQDGLKPL
jgi:hypothetical protein